MNSKYTILKLKSGEELITSVVKKEENEVLLTYPMVFKSIIIPDAFTGTQKEITVLRDWISYGKEQNITIPSDYVLTYTDPDEDATELYIREIEKKFSDDTPKRKLKDISNNKKDIQEELEDLLDDMEEAPDLGPLKFPKNGFGMIPMNEEFFREMMKGFENLEEGGSMDFEFDLTWSPEELNPNESTENELNHPDFGNRWTDWSSNPNEY